MFSILRSLFTSFLGIQDTHTNESPTMSFETDLGPFEPDICDVVVVKQMLVSTGQIPIEIVDEIIDFAQYWPHVSATSEAVVARGSTPKQDVFVLRTPPLRAAAAESSRSHERLSSPLPTFRAKHPVREIVWTLKSHDQGWSGEPPDTHGTYRCSHTWFDACIDRPLPNFFLSPSVTEATYSDSLLHKPAPLPSDPRPDDRSPQVQAEILRDAGFATVQPPIFPAEEGLEGDYHLQHNVQSKAQPTEHRIVWSYLDNMDPATSGQELSDVGKGSRSGDGTFVRCLQAGDCIALWARARYPAWSNFLDSASVSVYFAI